MLSDPIVVTYDGVSKSMPRVGMSSGRSHYKTADGELQLFISELRRNDGQTMVNVSLARTAPDPTPSNSFDDYREISNQFGLSFVVDPNRSFTSQDIPLLRAALLALVDTTLQNRIINGEK